MTLSPSQLLLDPTNPRLVTESVQYRKHTTESIRSKTTQDYVLDLVCRKEHGVKELITSITEFGFISGYQDIIVKELSKGGPFLVLEGNRRTAAIKYLLKSGGRLRSDVQKSIDPIPVKRFVYRPNATFDEPRVIDVLLGTIHIDGPREWGALERANFVHRSYLREYGLNRRFRYSLPVARKVGSTFRMSPKMVHKCLTISRVYDQLRTAGLPVEPKSYTLIDLATKTRAVAAPYFELDDTTCELSAIGVERFAKLCLGDHPPVHNPGLFKSFVHVATDGTELELEQVAEGDRNADDVSDAISVRQSRRAFKDDLEAIRAELANLSVAAYQGTEGEKVEIRRIKHIVDDVLMPLTRRG